MTNLSAFVSVEIVVDGSEFICLEMAGPQAIVGLEKAYEIEAGTWDYTLNQIGPGTLGFGKTRDEIAEMRNNYLIVPRKGTKDINFADAKLLRPSGLYLYEGGKPTDRIDDGALFYKAIRKALKA